MLFNSFSFVLFLPIVFLIYWSLPTTRARNVLIILASYIFYGWWDPRFLTLIIISSLADYGIGLLLLNQNSTNKRRILLLCSLFVNLGLLGFFKYYNFFIDSLVEGLLLFDIEANFKTLSIILPVGISFYTFQTLSYTIDVYRKKISPTRDLFSFLAYVSFFPQLVAGPIERAKNLLPQFQREQKFSYALAISGCKLILWGFFKKMVIADNLSPAVEAVFSNYQTLGSAELILGVVFFAFQIYCDFSGYSDIAIGIARLFNITLSKNFNFPYFSRSIGEFWRRWHISLNTWFRDYLYIPLGGSEGGKPKVIRNVFIVFVVSGLWHGANLTFVFWGLLNALFFIPSIILGSNRKHLDTVAENSVVASFQEIIQMISTFGLIAITWIFFRSETWSDGWQYTSRLFQFAPSANLFGLLIYLPYVGLLVIIEWLGRHKDCAIDHKIDNLWLGRIYYAIIAIFVILFASYDEQAFIYFQF
ncbi:MAG: MBOAT family O-acyltransferase [Reichenbachiella sp.]|uniref:MBOAT family O-acyltransferase n=1 Tax=Reichenbachiella sp. TaxID=2184521 RepID=UPI00326454E8